MTDLNPTPAIRWTIKRTALLATICMVAGIAGGWSIRALQNRVHGVRGTNPAVVPAQTASTAAPAQSEAGSTSQAPNPVQLKQMADFQAGPLLNQLKTSPDNPEVLTGIGNLYYDAQQYPVATGYYERALKLKPSDADVRTDLGTAYWYMGDAERAIAEFNKALTYVPGNPSTLFNRGLVRWKGKKDAAGAVSDWEKLLATNPNYEAKSQVEQMLAEVRGNMGLKPVTASR